MNSLLELINSTHNNKPRQRLGLPRLQLHLLSSNKYRTELSLVFVFLLLNLFWN